MLNAHKGLEAGKPTGDFYTFTNPNELLHTCFWSKNASTRYCIATFYELTLGVGAQQVAKLHRLSYFLSGFVGAVRLPAELAFCNMFCAFRAPLTAGFDRNLVALIVFEIRPYWWYK